MASLTVRQLDDQLKQRLRMRAARNGRSVEDEVRTILRAAADAGDGPDADFQKSSAEPSTRLKSAPQGEVSRQVEGQGVVLVIGGGIAAYKSLDLIRRLRERRITVRVVLTAAAQHFVTPLSVGALTGSPPFTDLFDPKSEFDVGHIRLARDCQMVVVAPATADLIAKMAGGHADDLASAVLLATDRPVLLAPAMNPHMWAHPATRRNLALVMGDGASIVGPNSGEMAERGEAGIGRMAEPLEIAAAVQSSLGDSKGLLRGLRMIVTSGPTHEPIDPVRYIANRSSGKQGHAIAAAAAQAGADVTLVSGPVELSDPAGVRVVHVQSARDMLAAVQSALPADIAVFAAAVADWRVAADHRGKLKKTGDGPPELALMENPDILATIAQMSADRPRLVIGFAAETERVIEHAQAKLARKRCDWILANDVSPATGIMGGDSNTVHLVTAEGVEEWPPQSKMEVAQALVRRIAAAQGRVP